MPTPIWPIEGVPLESDVAAVAGSLGYRIVRMYDDLYQPVGVYPTGVAGATIITAGTNWTLGTVAQIVPATTIHSPFLIQTVTVETLTGANIEGVYELVLYQGAADTEVARVRFSAFGGFFGMAVFRMPSALVPADSRVRGALMFSNAVAGAVTSTVSITYREVV
jgi:hypothetical protein